MIKVMPPVVINAISLYGGWYEIDPPVDRVSYLPVLVLPQDAVVSSLTPPNTVILRIVEN